jgi:hypothetical protein
LAQTSTHPDVLGLLLALCAIADALLIIIWWGQRIGRR